MDHNQLVDEIIKDYKTLPFETKELYKRYNIDIPIPDGASKAISESDAKEVGEFISMIAKESKIKFDIVVTDGRVENSNANVKVNELQVQNGEKKKLNETIEEKLAEYISLNSKNKIDIEIGDNKQEKINVLFISTGDLPIQVSINIGDNSKVDIFEWYSSVAKEQAIVAPMHRIKVGKGSHVEVNILHNENDKTVVGNLSKATVGDYSKFRLNYIYNGGSVLKATNSIEAAGIESDVLVNEIVFGANEQKFDINTFIVNSNVRTKARLESGAVLKGKSYCILKGYAKVGKGSRGAFSNLAEKGLLLDPDAHIKPLPDMSIDYGNEVIATHSASTTPMDQEVLFYLRSRGISEIRAKRIFVVGFLSKYLMNIENAIVKETAISIMLDKLDNDRYGNVPKITPENLWVVGARTM